MTRYCFINGEIVELDIIEDGKGHWVTRSNGIVLKSFCYGNEHAVVLAALRAIKSLRDDAIKVLCEHNTAVSDFELKYKHILEGDYDGEL